MTSDTTFKGWKYVPEDRKTRAIMCMMELLCAIQRRLPIEHNKHNEKAVDMLKLAELTTNRVIIDARQKIQLTDDNIIEMYLDITTK